MEFDYGEWETDPVARSYPVAQWVNGKVALKALKNVAYTGGLFLPAKYLSNGVTLAGWTPIGMTFGSGKNEAGMATDMPSLAVIRTRFCWQLVVPGSITYHPRSAYAPGMKGRLQILAAVRGYDAPVVVAFKGKASQLFEVMLKEFQAQVVNLANRSAPKGKYLPRYAFWMPVGVGKHQKASADYESVITPPTMLLPEEITTEYLHKLYVGKENLIRFQDWYKESADWQKEWDQPGQTESEPVHDDGEHAPAEEEEHYEEEPAVVQTKPDQPAAVQTEPKVEKSTPAPKPQTDASNTVIINGRARPADEKIGQAAVNHPWFQANVLAHARFKTNKGQFNTPYFKNHLRSHFKVDESADLTWGMLKALLDHIHDDHNDPRYYPPEEARLVKPTKAQPQAKSQPAAEPDPLPADILSGWQVQFKGETDPARFLEIANDMREGLRSHLFTLEPDGIAEMTKYFSEAWNNHG